ncbi:glycosyltransferase family 39 protein [Amycolatopsis suaedae]|uniref:Glycosyltransferase family 39 protein n=2 Tax=Amycolatopsis suaedae TaxID=2510978 RepID=A0A4V2ELC3_9PSEU|nr:glycosyltransferase family 39 protein [Amycolatopsis suaedae]
MRLTTVLARPFVRGGVVPWPVAVLAGMLGLLLLLTSGRYGYHGDELYFLSAGRHLDWSYVDQPPLTPLLARLMDTLFPGSVVALRVPAVACAVAGVLFAAVTAKELGGSLRAQVLTAAAVAGAPGVAAGGHVLTTSVVDTFLWIVCTWLLVRWGRRRDDRLLLWLGLVTAVALQVKYLIVFFWVVAGAAIIVAGPRGLLRRKTFWLGACIAAVTSAPALWWQARHGWPQLEMGEALVAQADPGGGGVVGYLVEVVVPLGVLGVLLLGGGLCRAFRSPELRFLGCTFAGLLLVFWFTFGHGYYMTGMYAGLVAIGAVGSDHVSGRWLPWVAWPAGVLSIAMLVMALPIRPVESLAGEDPDQNAMNFESVGWPQLADTVATVHGADAGATIVAHDYWVASALARYGPERGLPTAYSPHRGYWYFGMPSEDATTVVYVGGSEAQLRRYFTDVRHAGVVDNGLGIENSAQGTTIWLCRGPRQPWSALWPELRYL